MQQSGAISPEGYQRMSAFCNFGAFDLEQVTSVLENDERFRSLGDRLSIVSYTDVVHCRFSAGEQSRDAYIFPYRALVLWGFSSEQERTLLELLEPCATPISPSASASSDELADFEFMLYVPADPAEATERPRGAVIEGNVIRLRTDDPTEQLAFSFAFAQSAKLSVLEAALEATTEEIRQIPEQLSSTGRCRMSARTLAQLTGRVYLERNEVNLYSNILDCPDFFWEAEAFEPLYRRVSRYLDIDDRVTILNQRLDIVNDLLEGLSNQLEIRNSHRLEIIIIVLIMFEIAVELAKESVFPIPGLRRLVRWLVPVA